MRKLIVLTGVAVLVTAGAALADEQGETMKRLLAAKPSGPVVPTGYEVPGPTWYDYSTKRPYADTTKPKRVFSDQFGRGTASGGGGATSAGGN